MGRTGCRPRIPSKIHLDLPERLTDAFIAAFKVRLVEQTTRPWSFWLGLMDCFIEEFGHARVPFAYSVKGHRLGLWVMAQRRARLRGRLSPEREALLAALPGWVWNMHDARWEEAFPHMQRFVEINQHAQVPLGFVQDGFNLGYWVVHQRARYATGKMDPRRVERLQQLSGWTWRPVTAAVA
jgi:hypothetical protein